MTEYSILLHIKNPKLIDVTLLHAVELFIRGKPYHGYGTAQHITKDMLTEGLHLYGIHGDGVRLTKLYKDPSGHSMVFLSKEDILGDEESASIENYTFIEYGLFPQKDHNQ